MFPTEEQDYLETESSETPQDEDYSQEETLEEENADSEVQDADETDDGDEEEDEKILRYKQQLKGNKEEAMRFRQMILEEEISKAGKDANALLELHKKDPKLAIEVAKHYNFDSIEAVEDYIAGQRSPDQPITEEEIERRADRLAEKKLAQKQHDLAIDSATKRFNKLPKEAKETALKRFSTLSEGKILDLEEANEIAEMVTLYAQKEDLKSVKLNDAKAKMSSTGLKNSKKVQSGDYIVVNGKLVLDSIN